MVDHPIVGSVAIVLPVWFRLCRLRATLNKYRPRAIQ
jgi:hypothetical protein